jgi:hypothetical protein
LLGLAGQRCVQQIECHQGLLSSEQSRCLSAVEIEGYIMNISCVAMQIDTLFNSLGKDIMDTSIAMQTEHQQQLRLDIHQFQLHRSKQIKLHLPSVPNTLLALAICTIGMGKHHLGGCQPHLK